MAAVPGTMPAGTMPAGTGAAGASAPGTVTAGTVVVHVVGLVAHPGIVELPGGSRVSDAVAKAGGASRGADLGALNLARLVTDGEQIRVPKPGEVLLAPQGGTAASGSGAGGSGTGATPLVNLNTSDLTTLEGLPGVGPVLAQRILDWRAEHGRFASVDELAEVSGIGEKIFAQLQPKVTV